MDAFEQLVSEIMWAKGYWVRTSFKVELTKAEKVAIGRPSAPRWELDVVGYHAGENSLLALECKSYLDSPGVNLKEVSGEDKTTRYKMFREPKLRTTVLNRLCLQAVERGLARSGVTAELGLVAGRVQGDEAGLQSYCNELGWRFFGPGWLRESLNQLARGSYENQTSAVVAKLLLRTTAT